MILNAFLLLAVCVNSPLVLGYSAETQIQAGAHRLTFWHRTESIQCRVPRKDRIELANLRVPPYVTHPNITFSASQVSRMVRSLTVEVEGFVGGTRVERELLYELKPNVPRTLELRKEKSSRNEWETIDYTFAFLLQLNKDTSGLAGESGIDVSIEYNPVLLSPRFLAYFACTLVFVIVFRKRLTWEGFTRLADRTWTDWWITTTVVVSHSLVGLQFLDELGLFLSEWGYSPGVLGGLRTVLGISGISELLYLANLVVLVPAMYKILDNSIKYHMEHNVRQSGNDDVSWIEPYSKRASLHAALLLALLVLVFGLLQGLYWGLFENTLDLTSPSLWLALVLVAMPFIAIGRLLALIKPLTALNPYRRENWSRQFYFNTLMLLLFMLFSQSFITRILVVVPVVNWLRKWFRRKVLGKQRSSTWDLNIVRVRATREGWYRANFIFLTSMWVPLLMVWFMANSPLPPAGSIYPKTVTISFLYSVVVLLYLPLMPTQKWISWKSICWMACSLFILHGAFLLAPGWYYPSLNADIASAFEFSNQLFGVPAYGALFSFLMHLFALAYFALALSLLSSVDELRNAGYRSTRVFWSQVFHRHAGILLAAVFLYALFGVIMASEKAAIAGALRGGDGGLKIIVSAMLNVYFTSVLLFVPPMKTFYNNVFDAGGKEAVTYLQVHHPWLRLFKSWNDGERTALAVACFVLFQAGVFALGWGFCDLSLARTKSAAIIEWHSLVPSSELIRNVEVTGDLVLVAGSSHLVALDRRTGRLVWQKQYTWPQFEIASDSTIWVVGRQNVWLLAKATGDVIAGHQLQQASSAETDSRFGIFEGQAVYQFKNKAFVIDPEVGLSKVCAPIMTGLFPKASGGPFCWVDSLHQLWRLSKEGSRELVAAFGVPPLRLISLPGGIVASFKDSLRYYDVDKRRSWVCTDLRYAHPSWLEAGEKNGVLVVGGPDKGVLAFSIADGTILWRCPNYSVLTSPFMQAMEMSDGIVLLRGNDGYRLKGVFLRTGVEAFTSGEGMIGRCKKNSFVAMSLTHWEIFDDRTGALLQRDPYILAVAKAHLFNISDQLDNARPAAIVLDANTILWGNGHGIFCGKAD